MEIYQTNLWVPDKSTTDGISVALLIIDPQNDFHDKETEHSTASLPVTGSSNDAKTIESFINTYSKQISNIFVTLDSHERFHICHRLFWQNSKGENPPTNDLGKLTLISIDDINKGNWTPSRKEFLQYSREYVTKLDENKRNKLIIWPDHCIIGTPGHNVVKPVRDALAKWEIEGKKATNYVIKGNNSLTEHYSVFKADVPIDPATNMNYELVEKLSMFDKVIVCGQAKSHCVKFSVEDLVSVWERQYRRSVKDIILLEDCMSNVYGFDQQGNTFIDDMKKKGLTVKNSKDIKKLDELGKRTQSEILVPDCMERFVRERIEELNRSELGVFTDCMDFTPVDRYLCFGKKKNKKKKHHRIIS